MTNAEKFKDVFGFNPDIEALIYDCPTHSLSEKCKYQDDLGCCHCESWWQDEYVKEKRNE